MLYEIILFFIRSIIIFFFAYFTQSYDKYNAVEENHSKYAGGSYGGFNEGGDRMTNKWEAREGQSEFKVPDLEAVQRNRRENRAKRAGVGGKEQLFYLDEDDDDVPEKVENYGPVKNLEDDVQLTTQERRAFNANGMCTKKSGEECDLKWTDDEE